MAIVWPPGKPPIVIAAYFNTSTPAHTVRDEEQAVLATVGSIAASWQT